MTAQHSDLVAVVARRAGVTREQADVTLRATLHALAAHVDAQLVHQLMPTLPPAFADLDLPAGGPAEPAAVSQLMATVAERDQLEPARVERRVWAVLAALDAEPATSDPLRTLLAVAGTPYQHLLPPPEPLRTEAGLIDALRARLDLSSDEHARQAFAATLATLGRELSPGQAADLQHWLPPSLRNGLTDTQAEGLDRGQFLRDIAARRDLDTESARAEAHTVLGLLREVAPENEIANTLSQLPDRVAELLR